MRSSFERLSYYVRDRMERNLSAGHVFVFVGKNRRRPKALVYDGSGLILITKRLEKNRFMNLEELEKRLEISLFELELLLHGSVIRKYKPDGEIKI